MHRYEDAATVLRSSMASVKAGKQGIAHLSLGLVYLKNAELYREFHRTSVSVHLEYLEKLAAFQGDTRSRLVDLYLGEALLGSGRPGEAARAFERCIPDTRGREKERAIARRRDGQPAPSIKLLV